MKRTNDFVVGIVVILAVVATIGATLWAKQADLGRKREGVVARFRDAGQVRVGDAVVIRGVQAGRVQNIELADDGWVEMRLALEPGAPIPADPAALLSVSSLFGEWQVTVVDRAELPDDEVVRRQIAEAGAPGIIPGSALPDVGRLTATAGRIAEDMAHVARRFDFAFDDTAARNLRTSIGNFATLSTDLAQTVRQQSGRLDRITGEVQVSVQSLGRTAANFQRVAARLDSSASPARVDQIASDLARAARQTEEATAELRTMAAELRRSQAVLARTLAMTDSVMTKVNAGQGSLGMLVNDASLYRHSDSLVVSLRDLVADVKKRPKRYVSLELF